MDAGGQRSTGGLDKLSPAGGSPCDITQRFPRALTKTNKPPYQLEMSLVTQKNCQGLRLSPTGNYFG